MSKLFKKIVSVILSISIVVSTALPGLALERGLSEVEASKIIGPGPIENPYISEEYLAELNIAIAEAKAEKQKMSTQSMSAEVATLNAKESVKADARATQALLVEKEMLSSVLTDKALRTQSTTRALFAMPSVLEGSGTAADPYIVSTADELKKVVNNLSAYYILSNNIDISGSEWTPIGSNTTPFIGSFDGNGFTIAGLTINSTAAFKGLFGYASNATIKNLTVADANVSGGSKVGVLIGQGSGCTISNINLVGCTVSGTGIVGGLGGIFSNTTITNGNNNTVVSSTGTYSGGYTGFMSGGQIMNVVFTGEVTGTSYAGGLVGALYADIYNSTNTGNISGLDTVGGIAGELSYSSRLGFVANCYNSGEIAGTTEVGGIAGYALSTTNTSYGANLVATANSGKVSASASYAGGIVGDMACNTVVVSAYNRGRIQASTTYGGIAGRFNQITTYISAARNLYNAADIPQGTLAGALIGYSRATVVANAYYMYPHASGYDMPAISNKLSSASCVYWPVSVVRLKGLASTLGTAFSYDKYVVNNGFPILTKLNYYRPNNNAGYFRFRGDVTADYDLIAPYYYEDTYFEQDAYTYNEHLSTMSLSLALSAGASRENTVDKQYANAENLLTDIGFSNIVVNDDFASVPTTDSIGVITGIKTITIENEPVTIIAVALRGAGYEKEWAGNFKIGETGFHEGFKEARDKVITHLKAYVANPANGISGDVKIWITGYSRAAATANLVAGALDNGVALEDCTYTPQDVYAYTFETPRGALKAEALDANDAAKPLYKNIFNIVNHNDLVPKVAPNAWDFTWFGNVMPTPTAAYDGDNYPVLRAKMEARYNALGFSAYTPYIVDNFVVKEFGFTSDDPYDFDFTYRVIDVEGLQNVFLDSAIDKLANDVIGGRANYVSNFQDGIGNVFAVLGTDEFGKIFEKKMKDKLPVIFLVTGFFITPATMLQIPSLSAYATLVLIDLIEGLVVESAEECGVVLTEQEINTFASNVLFLLLEFGETFPDETVTLTGNLDTISQAHYAEICLAWIQSLDSHFNSGTGASFAAAQSSSYEMSNLSGYRVVRVNGAVDIAVYNSDDMLVSSITAGVPGEENVGACVVNKDDEMTVYLPADGEYNIIITATGGGLLSYNVSEFNEVGGGTRRIVDFADTAITAGATFTANIPVWAGPVVFDAYSNNIYTIKNSENADILVDTELTGDNAAHSYYSVAATANNNAYGLVLGRGSRRYGSYAKVSARPLNGYIFTGWYAGDTLVSTAQDYKFKVTTDIALVAVFEASPVPAE